MSNWGTHAYVLHIAVLKHVHLKQVQVTVSVIALHFTQTILTCHALTNRFKSVRAVRVPFCDSNIDRLEL